MSGIALIKPIQASFRTHSNTEPLRSCGIPKIHLRGSIKLSLNKKENCRPRQASWNVQDLDIHGEVRNSAASSISEVRWKTTSRRVWSMINTCMAVAYINAILFIAFSWSSFALFSRFSASSSSFLASPSTSPVFSFSCLAFSFNSRVFWSWLTGTQSVSNQMYKLLESSLAPWSAHLSATSRYRSSGSERLPSSSSSPRILSIAL